MSAPADLSGAMIRGAAWMVAMRWGLRLIGLVNVAILARILAPEDFGISAMAWVVAELLITLADANVDMALLRDRHAGRPEYDTAWTIQVLAGFATMAALLALAPLAAAYYDDDRVGVVMAIVALRAAIMGFENIGVVLFRARLDFAREFRYWMIRRLLMFGIGLGLALWLRDYMALALAAPVSAVVTVAVSFVMSDYRPRFCLKSWRRLWSFSRWQIVTCTARHAAQRVDEFIVGGMVPAATTGAYYLASDIAALPTREVIQPVGRALLPAYAHLSHDEAGMARALRGLLAFTALLCLPAGIGLSVLAEDAVLVLLGPQWGEAVGFFRWLALYAALEGFFLALEPGLVARGAEKGLALANLAHVAVLVPVLVAAGSFWDVEAVAAARVAVTALVLAALFAVMMRAGWIGTRALAGLLWRPGVAGLVMGGAVFQVAAAPLPPLARLIAGILAGMAVYGCALLALWHCAGRPQGPEERILSLLRRRSAGTDIPPSPAG